jgi:hypothetical protein
MATGTTWSLNLKKQLLAFHRNYTVPDFLPSSLMCNVIHTFEIPEGVNQADLVLDLIKDAIADSNLFKERWAGMLEKMRSLQEEGPAKM